MTEALTQTILDQNETSYLYISMAIVAITFISLLIEDLSDITEALTQTILNKIETSNLDISSQMLL